MQKPHIPRSSGPTSNTPPNQGSGQSDLTSERQRGYSMGYQAGKRYADNSVRLRTEAEKREFLDKAMLAALPVCINLTGWSINGIPCTTTEHKMQLAAQFAKAAWNERIKL